MTDSRETKLEMARRHLLEGEEHVARQREIFASLPADTELGRTARRLLAEFENTLRDHRATLARLEEADHGN